MGYILSSDGFAKFMEMLSGCEGSLDLLEGQIGDALAHVKDELHLGKAAMIMEVHPNAFQLRGRSISHDFYTSEKGYATEAIKESYITGNKGVFNMFFHPEIGYVWNEDEKKAVRTLSNAIYISMRRVRLKELVERAMLTDSMTMVSNAMGMKRFVTQIIEKNNHSAYNCAFMNIKNFRYYNQKVGSTQGDELLKVYATKINDFLLPDENITRMGGDNFIVYVKKERVGAFFERMKKINVQLWVDNHPISLDV